MKLPIDTENHDPDDRGPNAWSGERQVCTDTGVQVQKLLVTVEDASELLSIGRTSTYELVMRGTISSVKIGRRRLVVRAALTEYVQRLLELQGAS